MNQSPPEDIKSHGKSRVERLFQFIRAFTNSRNPIKRQLLEQPASEWQINWATLPDESEWIEHWSGSEDDREWLLRVKVCPPVPCESPPKICSDWVLPGWERFSESARHVSERSIPTTKDSSRIEKFEDSFERKSAWDEWLLRRHVWVRDQRRHTPVRELFSKLQTLRAELQKRSEQVELVLGVGLFQHTSSAQSYCHPLILKTLDIEFDSQKNCFTLLETDRPTELYLEPLAELQIDLTPAGHWRDQLQRLHPLDSQTVITIKGIWDWLRNQPELVEALFEHKPVAFLRDRGGWPARAATAVLDDLAKRPEYELPPYLLRLVGGEPVESTTDDAPPSTDFLANEDEKILFALPANLEQLQLARQLERKDVVLVQGPPGTGKTHTIANLLGHLLSQGKRVLVTSHTSKALRVLRDKVPENIQSLCVSVLDDASRSKRELEHAVQAIAERMQTGTASLLQKAKQLEGDRAEILRKIQQKRAELRLCIRREYEPLMIAGDSIEPSRAAREVYANEAKHAWIPGPLNPDELGAVCPLSANEVQWLYASQIELSEADEAQFINGIPSRESLPTPLHFEARVLELAKFEQLAAPVFNPIWSSLRAKPADLESLVTLANDARASLTHLTEAGRWLLTLVESGSVDQANEVWNELHDLNAQVSSLYSQSLSALLNHAPQLPEQLLNESSKLVLSEIVSHLTQGGGLKALQIPLKVHLSGKWKLILENATCNEKKPNQIEQFLALQMYVDLQLLRDHLKRRWNRQVEVIGGPALPPKTPEKAAQDWLPYITEALHWFSHKRKPLVDGISNLGRSWESIESLVPPLSTANPRLERTIRLIEVHLLPEWNSYIAHYKASAIRKELALIAKHLSYEFPQSAFGVVPRLRDSLEASNSASYEAVFQELERLWLLQVSFNSRNIYLKKLEKGALNWSQAVRLRNTGHDKSLDKHVDVAAAWRWRQLNDQLVYRSVLNPETIAEELRQLSQALNTITGDLISARCWASQLSIAEKFRLHLVGWLDTMRKIGKGTGKNVDIYRAESRSQLKHGQLAVPVWIMPLAEVFRSLNVQDGRFDVVIIDEASQAGISGLLAAYLGKKVVVVGDHEQVSPDAVGEDLAISRSLQIQYLDGFPNTVLYDGKLSLYDMSRWTASGMLTLSEHFRCLPAIIGFSNRLSYSGRIRPLRDPSTSLLRAVIPHRVNGMREGRQKINKEEALETVSLILAMSKHENYVGRSIGVISLLGDEQAKYIENLLRQHLPVAEMENRKIICGNAAQFQGDERDVIFLTMIDSNEGDGPMRKFGEGSNDLNKKRYNVAASRAQNQMWILHSLNYQTDLKPDDLRRDLLEYAHTEAQIHIDDDTHQRTDSEFERLILEALISRGYKVKTQYAVGYYRIDMVVEYEGRKLAVECDGERWHSGEEKIAEDFARQAVLERLGWRFHRIRGSLFFRDPEKAMQLLWERLGKLNILPTATEYAISPELDIHDSLLRLAKSEKEELMRKHDVLNA